MQGKKILCNSGGFYIPEVSVFIISLLTSYVHLVITACKHRRVCGWSIGRPSWWSAYQVCWNPFSFLASDSIFNRLFKRIVYTDWMWLSENKMSYFIISFLSSLDRDSCRCGLKIPQYFNFPLSIINMIVFQKLLVGVEETSCVLTCVSSTQVQ